MVSFTRMAGHLYICCFTLSKLLVSNSFNNLNHTSFYGLWDSFRSLLCCWCSGEATAQRLGILMSQSPQQKHTLLTTLYMWAHHRSTLYWLFQDTELRCLCVEKETSVILWDCARHFTQQKKVCFVRGVDWGLRHRGPGVSDLLTVPGITFLSSLRYTLPPSFLLSYSLGISTP